VLCLRKYESLHVCVYVCYLRFGNSIILQDYAWCIKSDGAQV
jgi:hypothetical protein